MSLAGISTVTNPISIAPKGCSSSTDPRYFTLCDLNAVWGIVIEAIAGAGILTSFVLLLVMVSSLPFVIDRRRMSVMALQVTFLIFNLGLFGLSFAFIMGRDITICTARSFVFGVLFAGCFACLLMHGLWLTLLERYEKSPPGWLFWLGALGLFLVEVIVNTEWMIITQMTQGNAALIKDICDITKQDFTIALTYVMVLLVAVVLMAVLSMTHTNKSFRQDALYILLTGLLSISVWLVWIVMYIHGNKVLDHSNWDDATLAIALVSNGWVFLIMYAIPETYAFTKDIKDVGEILEGQQCSSRITIYENFLRDQTTSQQGVGIGNKAISKHELDTAKTLVSPYSEYNGQVRSNVYQATELAIIGKGQTIVSMMKSLTRKHSLVQQLHLWSQAAAVVCLQIAFIYNRTDSRNSTLLGPLDYSLDSTLSFLLCV